MTQREAESALESAAWNSDGLPHWRLTKGSIEIAEQERCVVKVDDAGFVAGLGVVINEDGK